MPHLCPMNWPIALIMFWMILMITYSSTWWLQLPSFPKILFQKKMPPSPWNWK